VEEGDMSVISERAAIGRALFDIMRTPDFRAWLDETAAGAIDEDGDLVSISVCDGEQAWTMVEETAEHPHDVVVCTLHRGQMVAWVLGPSLPEDDSPIARGVPVGNAMTVGDVIDEMLQLPRRMDYVLEFDGQRHRATLAPMAA
jgi:hypothetical protein